MILDQRPQSDPLSGLRGWGQKLKIQLLQNMVMLHMKKYISMPLRMSIVSLTGILVGPKVLSVASQTVLLHILGSRGSHIFLQIDHEVISKVIRTPSAAQLQTFKNMTFFKMSKYDIPPDFECQNSILNVKVRYSASVRMPNMILNVKIRYSAHFRISN